MKLKIIFTILYKVLMKTIYIYLKVIIIYLYTKFSNFKDKIK